MSGIVRIAVAITALASLSGVLVWTANAVTWDNSGSTAFTATAGSGTLTSTGVSLSCAGGRAFGTAASGPTVGAIYKSSGTATGLACNLAGVSTSVHCTWTLTGTSQAGAVTTGATDETCFLSQFATVICIIHGPTPGQYVNPSGTTPGRITALASNTVKLTNAGSGTCPLGSNDIAAVTHKSQTVTNGIPTAFGPLITRTP